MRVGIYTQILRNEQSMYRAVDSVLKQSYTNFKYYILVGNTTREAIRQYTVSEPHVEILEEESAGDYNAVIKYIAQDYNKYVSILDADDWYDKTYLEEQVNFAEKYKLDITAAGNYFADTAGTILGKRNSENLVWNRAETGQVLPYMYGFFRTIWGKLISANILIKYNESRLPNTNEYGGYGGDTLFMFNLLYDAERIGIQKKILYYYTMSETSDSYTLKPGRLQSDEIVFHFAENTLQDICSYGDLQKRFLLQVYGNALMDTIELLLYQPISEDIRTEKLLACFEKPLSQELLNRERNNSLILKEIQIKVPFSKKLYHSLFNKSRIYSKNEKTMGLYLKIYKYLFPKWKDTFSADEFAILLEEQKLLDMFTEGLYPELFDSLIDRIKIDPMKLGAIRLLRRIAKNNIVKKACKDSMFISVYSELLKSINRDEMQKALKICRLFFSKEEPPSQSETLVEIWTCVAAFIENAEDFILSKKIKAQILLENRKYEEGELELNDLIGMGIWDEDISALKEQLSSFQNQNTGLNNE